MPDTPFFASGESVTYGSLVLEHFWHPRNTGRHPPGPEILRTRAGSRAAGAEVALSFQVKAGLIAEVRFQAFGCPHFLAAASLATQELRGRPLPELTAWRATPIGERLGFPVEKRGRLLILED